MPPGRKEKRSVVVTELADVPPDLVVDFDVYDPMLTMPVDRMQEKVAELARRGPVVYSTAYGGHWVVTSYDAVHRVLREHETFSSYPNNLVDAGQGKFIPLELDPPEHTLYRHALQPLFSPSRIKVLEQGIRRTVNELIDDFAARGRCEYVAEFAHQLPTRVFLELLGWPLSDASMFAEATEILLNGRPGDTPEQAVGSRTEAAMSLFGYFQRMVDERRGAPADSDDVTAQVMQAMVTADGAQRPLDDDELRRVFLLLLIGGLHTVRGSLCWALMHLSAHPQERKLLVDDPGLIPNAVEEVLRYEAAVSAGRRVRHDTELGGVALREGDQLLVMLCGANRDGEQFDGPDELRINRTPNRHLSFGSGPHRCIGSHLGRIELRIALEEIHRRIPDYALDPADPPVILPSQVRGFQRMGITFGPERETPGKTQNAPGNVDVEVTEVQV
ncbi:cytochrome [Frankia sp. CcI49]|uniref:cytochrome P450 n=1 Tax=unclassified Frankia TaxID=2632575 RepID=UPI0006CA22E9|nr:cytochrome P450 [Frankia sp. R43]ONH49968.1 cytochrome [Frankia sp. CcI49]